MNHRQSWSGKRRLPPKYQQSPKAVTVDIDRMCVPAYEAEGKSLIQ
jgi:hypothetical protein